MTTTRRDPLAARNDQPVALASEGNAPAIALKYDYDQLPAEHREAVREAATDIKRRERRAAMDIVEIGRSLKDVQARLDHGEFLPWLDTEFGWQKSMAYNFIAVADKFPKFGNLEQFGLSALYLLSGPSVPDEAIAEANEAAQRGERVTHKAAKQIVERHKPPKPAAAQPRALTTRETLAVIMEAVKRGAPAAQRSDWLAKHDQMSDYTGGLNPGVALVASAFEAAYNDAMLQLSERTPTGDELAAALTPAPGDKPDAMPAQPGPDQTPADLAAAGWQLRTMARVGKASGWWLHNQARNLATNVFDDQATAIREAYAKQNGATPAATPSDGQQARQFRIRGELARWREVLGCVEVIGELTGRFTLAAPLRREIEAVIKAYEENVTE